MDINPRIFREYDIRGIAGEDLNEEIFAQFGRAYVKMLGRKKQHKCVAVARDGRLTSKHYAQALIDGITSMGINVLDIGEAPSPLLYYALFTEKVDGGVMITASHNPPEYNGMKCTVGSAALHGKDITKLGEIARTTEFEPPKTTTTVTKKDLVPRYIKRITRDVKLKRKLKVCVDAGNGVAGPIAVPLLEALGCEVVPIYCDVDGTFPNHPADPTIDANNRDLVKLVKKEKADIGIGYDGDGDRLGVIDEKGNMIPGDKLMILFSRNVLKDKPGAAIIGEVKCSRTLYEDIEKNGGKAIMSKTGHSIIKAGMKKHKAQLAGEMSGHIFFQHRWYGFDDGLYSSARILEILAAGRKPMSALLADVPKTFATPEVKISTTEERKFDVVAQARDHFVAQGYDVNPTDGARIEFEDGWGLIRASNTSPYLVMRCEAYSKKRLNAIQKMIEEVVNKLNN